MRRLLILIICLFCFLPVKIYALEYLPNGKSGILIEANSGKIIFSKNENERLSIASMTKMVAQIIILEEVENGNIKWNDIVTVSRNAAGMGGSQIYISEGEKISVEDLMKGISVASGNDATVAMAEYISGSEEKFVKRMNKKVKELGLKNTHFSNCTGLDEEKHYSTSYDMAMIARELVVNHSEILRFSSIYDDYLREGSTNKFWLVNTNKLINSYDGADGLKTGHTDDAGYCLAATAKRNNLRLIGIVLGEENSKVRNSEMVNLLDYGFNTLKVNTLKRKGSIVEKVKLEKANKKYLEFYLKDDLNVFEEDVSKKKYDYKIELNEIKYPIYKGDIIGKINATLNNKVVATSDLVSNKNIYKIKYFDLIVQNIWNIIIGR